MRRVADVMQSPPVTLEASATIQEAAARMLDRRVHAALVTDDGRVCGLATADLLSTALAQGYDAVETAVGAVADLEPIILAPDDALADAHARMRADGRRVAPVVGRRREPLGILEDPEASPAVP